MKDDIKEQHESYGLAGFSRISSTGNNPLFGSSIGHGDFIELRISNGEHIRSSDLSYDRYYARDEIICVQMSQTQFAEMITTMNSGDGNPVTIKRIGGKTMEKPPIHNKRNAHSKEFKEKMVRFTKTLENGQNELLRLLKKPKLSKDDKQQMKFLFEHLSTNIKSNIPYFERAFEEQMDKTVVEAKGEIESFITNAVHKTGLEALQDKGLMLGYGKPDNNIIEIGSK